MTEEDIARESKVLMYLLARAGIALVVTLEEDEEGRRFAGLELLGSGEPPPPEMDDFRDRYKDSILEILKKAIPSDARPAEKIVLDPKLMADLNEVLEATEES